MDQTKNLGGNLTRFRNRYRYGKFQEETNANCMKVLELQQKLSSEKLECTPYSTREQRRKEA